MLDKLNNENIMQKRIKVYDKFQSKEIGRLNPYYNYRIFAFNRHNGKFLKDREIDLICRFFMYFITDNHLSVSECLYRIKDYFNNRQTIYDILDKLFINLQDITEHDRYIMYIYCANNYKIDSTVNVMKRRHHDEKYIIDDIEHALEVFGIANIVWHDEYDKFIYDNYKIYYDKYDSEKSLDVLEMRRFAKDTSHGLGDPTMFSVKDSTFKYFLEKYGTDFILENYYDRYERYAKIGSYGIMLDSLKRNEDDIRVEHVQELVNKKWPLAMIQREMGFSSRYALKRYLDKYNIDYSGCINRSGRPRGSFKNTTARNKIYADFSLGLVPDAIYKKYEGQYSKRSIDRIYNEWKEDQADYKR